MWGATFSAPQNGCVRRRFQSTLPVWGATIFLRRQPRPIVNFNPRSPCGERLFLRCTIRINKRFQSTLPVWGATYVLKRTGSSAEFQSTLPVWGATGWTSTTTQSQEISIHAPRVGSDLAPACPSGCARISIHAPRVGSDPSLPCKPSFPRYFNPRSPCGERRKPSVIHPAKKRFQSTLPVWGATIMDKSVPDSFSISIHAPRVGSDDSRRNLHDG